jgi:thymidylate kinase
MYPDATDARGTADHPFLVTFSGIDGAGKTTQIDYLVSYLHTLGLRVLLLSFWDHVAVWPRLRAGVGHRAVDPCHPDQIKKATFAPKNHKHIRKWYLTGARLALYLLDVARLRRLLGSQDVRNFDAVIFDRYIYDQIANIYSRSSAARIYRKFLLKHTPTPDLAFILDASPDAAFARKPEYPLEFLHQNRENFLRLRELAPQLITIPDSDVGGVRREIQLHICRSLLAKIEAHEGKAEVATEGTVVPPQSSCRV